MTQSLNTEKLKSAFQDFLKNLNKGKRKSANPETYGFAESSFDSATIPAPQQASSFPQFIVKATPKTIEYVLFYSKADTDPLPVMRHLLDRVVTGKSRKEVLVQYPDRHIVLKSSLRKNELDWIETMSVGKKNGFL